MVVVGHAVVDPPDDAVQLKLGQLVMLNRQAQWTTGLVFEHLHTQSWTICAEVAALVSVLKPVGMDE